MSSSRTWRPNAARTPGRLGCLRSRGYDWYKGDPTRFFWTPGVTTQKAVLLGGLLRYGTRRAGNRNRTYDLRITNAPLYQLSYPGKEPQSLRCTAGCRKGGRRLANRAHGPVRLGGREPQRAWRSTLGSAKVTSSRTPSSSLTSPAPHSCNLATTPRTSRSGAEAPAVTPTCCTSRSHSRC